MRVRVRPPRKPSVRPPLGPGFRRMESQSRTCVKLRDSHFSARFYHNAWLSSLLPWFTVFTLFTLFTCFTCLHRDTPVHVLLNKIDLFEEMIQEVPLTACFPEYSGPPGEVSPAISFIEGGDGTDVSSFDAAVCPCPGGQAIYPAIPQQRFATYKCPYIRYIYLRSIHITCTHIVVVVSHI